MFYGQDAYFVGFPYGKFFTDPKGTRYLLDFGSAWNH